MTSHSDSSNSVTRGESDANWTWMQSRVDQLCEDGLSQWLDGELAELEAHFADLVTNRSSLKSLRSDSQSPSPK